MNQPTTPSGDTPEGMRQRVFARDGYACQYCGWTSLAPFGNLLEADHRLPVVSGGATQEFNLLTACRGCNREKGDRTENEYRFFRLMNQEDCNRGPFGNMFGRLVR